MFWGQAGAAAATTVPGERHLEDELGGSGTERRGEKNTESAGKDSSLPPLSFIVTSLKE